VRFGKALTLLGRVRTVKDSSDFRKALLEIEAIPPWRRFVASAPYNAAAVLNRITISRLASYN
jgi:hypothetical protein